MFRYDEEDRPASPLVEWWRWSKRNTGDDFRSWKRQAMPTLVTMAVIYVGFALVKPEVVSDKLFGAALSFLATAIALPVFRLVVNMARAPYGILSERNEQLEQEVRDLRELISGREAELLKIKPSTTAQATQVSVSTLAELRKSAIRNLLNRAVWSREELARLEADIHTWETEVESVLVQLAAPDEVMDFQVLGTYRPTVSGGLNKQHDRILSMLWERLERLKRVIKRLGRPYVKP